MKYFSVDEAEALIPELERIFEAVADLASQAQAKARAAERLAAAKPDAAAEIALARAQAQFLAGQIEAKLKSIMDLGAVPKGLDPALVDFPGKIDGEEAFLCWRLGEKHITQYHGVDDGFGGRKPIPRRRPS